MSRLSYEAYGRLASTNCTDTEAAGRYGNQGNAEKRVVKDVLKKLDLNSEDHFLEIGSGPGTLFIPLSFFVKTATCIDNPKVLERLNKRFTDPTINLVGGNFLDLNLESKYSKVLVYSVLQMLSNEKELLVFVERAAALLDAGGTILFGDLPNEDLKKRFLSTPEGREFDKNWKTDVEGFTHFQTGLYKDTETVSINDQIIEKIRNRLDVLGLKSEILAQPKDLPFGNTRQDLLVKST